MEEAYLCNFGLVRVTAQRTEATGEDLYDPALGVRCGVDT